MGLGLQAGNVDQIVAARQKALIDLKNLDQNQVEARRDQERIIRATTTELERLADGSSEINAVTEAMDRNLQAIEKERRAREQVTGVIEDFVVGGVEVRRGLVEAASGVRQAFATGTLQLQTPEQRRATVGLLDRLSDVQLAGGMTGKQIKQELVFRDAIRLGLDPELAQAIATGTSTEEKLIEANKQLTLSILVLATRMQDAALGLALPDGFATGGMVQYRAGGGSIFKPKGTDTVPAMLSPGEFVIRKSSVDKIGADTLAAINEGGVAYRDEGSEKPEKKETSSERHFRELAEKKKEQQERNRLRRQSQETIQRASGGAGRPVIYGVTPTDPLEMNEAQFFSTPRTEQERKTFEAREFLAGFTGDGYQENLSKNVQTANTFAGGVQGNPAIEQTLSDVGSLFSSPVEGSTVEGRSLKAQSARLYGQQGSFSPGGAEALDRTRNLDQEALNRQQAVVDEFLSDVATTSDVRTMYDPEKNPETIKRREKIAQDSIDLDRAVRQGYKPSWLTSTPSSPPPRDPADNSVLTPTEFMNRQKESRAKAQTTQASNSALKSTLFIAFTMQMIRANNVDLESSQIDAAVAEIQSGAGDIAGTG